MLPYMAEIENLCYGNARGVSTDCLRKSTIWIRPVNHNKILISWRSLLEAQYAIMVTDSVDYAHLIESFASYCKMQVSLWLKSSNCKR
jgi:hypothetical protein